MLKTPKITVLITLYNKGDYVEEAVQSVLDQRFTDLELLVVDDAGTDDGLAKVKAISDPRIRIMESAENTGRAAAANRGIEAAQGEFIAFLDADDIMYPERLAKQVAFLDAHHEVTIVGTDVEELRGQDKQPSSWPRSHEAAMAGLVFGDAYLHPSSLVRRSLFSDPSVRFNGGWRTPGMDYLFQVAVCRKAVFANLPEVLGAYRRGGNNFRSGRNWRQDRLLIARETFRLLGWPVSEAEVDAHVTLTGYLPAGLKAADVRHLRQWRDRLLALNQAFHLADPALFAQQVMDHWHRLYHRVADQGWGPGLAFWRHSPARTGAWLAYLAKVQLKGAAKPAHEGE